MNWKFIFRLTLTILLIHYNIARKKICPLKYFQAALVDNNSNVDFPYHMIFLNLKNT